MDSDTMFYGANPKIFKSAKKFRANPTPAEQKLWSHLSNNKLGTKFRRQHPVDTFIADFYCHQFKLVIEIDGDIHDTSERKEYDIARTEELNQFGISVYSI